jgi:hypothetical protein
MEQQLTQLEIELLAIVRTMSSKLLEVADHIRSYHAGECIAPPIEMACDCEANAEYSDYMKEFDIMKQFNYK